MKFAILWGVALTALTGCTSTNRPSNAVAEAEERPAGEGVLCAAALYSVADEVGRRCFPGKDAAFQAELARSLAATDDYILRDPAWTKDGLDRFRNEQGGAGASNESLCRGDTVMIYKALAAAGPNALRSSTNKLISRPGKPAWGDCL